MSAKPRLHIIGSFDSGNGATFGAGVFTTSAFTPPSNCLLVVFVSEVPSTDDASDGTGITIDDTGADLAWSTRIQSARMPSWSGGSACFTAPVKQGVSMQLQLDAGASVVEGYIVHVFALTDYDVLNPVGATASGTDADGDAAATINLSSAPQQTSIVLGHAHAVNGGGVATSITQGAGWDEIFDTQLVARFLNAQTQWLNKPTDVGIPWVDLDVNGATATGAVMLGIEIRGAPDTRGATPDEFSALIDEPDDFLAELRGAWFDADYVIEKWFDEDLEPGDASISGSLNETLDDLTLDGVGAVDIAGTLSQTLGALALDADGAVNVDGALSRTLDDLTLDAEGTVQDPAADIEGTLDETLGDLTLAGTGTVTVDGTLNQTLDDLALDGTGAVTIDGSLNRTLGALTLSAQGDNGEEPSAPTEDYSVRARRRGRR